MADDRNRIPTFLNPQFTRQWDDKPEGEKQGSTQHVPKPRTTFNLGEWIKDFSWADLAGSFGFPGASLATEASLFVEVAKDSLLDLIGGVVLQTIQIGYKGHTSTTFMKVTADGATIDGKKINIG